MRYELPPLPYDVHALEPHVSAETLAYHHGEHHREYVDKLNTLVRGTGFEGRALDDIVAHAGDGPLYDNAAEVWNHTFFWECMSPRGGGYPDGELGEAINASFGSFAAFKRAFEDVALHMFGSGWLWLVKTTPDTVNIQPTKDAYNPIRHGRIVLLTCDLWEHAYYIDHRNDRSAYLAAFWEVVNWDFANQRMHDTRF
ncbi:MAG: superoxide dismutase [Pseudomonadota bacterium]